MSSAVPTATTPTAAPTETPQERLLRLERNYREAARTLIDLKDQLTKNQDQVLIAQDAAFKAFEVFSAGKESYLLNVITAQRNQLQKMATPQQVLLTVPEVTPEQEAQVTPRADNVDTQPEAQAVEQSAQTPVEQSAQVPVEQPSA